MCGWRFEDKQQGFIVQLLNAPGLNADNFSIV